jgi:hypothetical protein
VPGASWAPTEYLLEESTVDSSQSTVHSGQSEKRCPLCKALREHD